MHVGVMCHRRTPSVEHRCDPDPGPEVFGVCSDPDHRVRARSHQQIVDLAFVLVSDIGDRFGQREDQMEIPHGQQFGPTSGQPCFCRPRLTLWAMAIASGIIGNM